MKVLVGVKLVVDANVKVRVRADGSGVETAGLNSFTVSAQRNNAGSSAEALR